MLPTACVADQEVKTESTNEYVWTLYTMSL